MRESMRINTRPTLIKSRSAKHAAKENHLSTVYCIGIVPWELVFSFMMFDVPLTYLNMPLDVNSY